MHQSTVSDVKNVTCSNKYKDLEKLRQYRTMTKIVATSPNVCLQLQDIGKENIPNLYLSLYACDFRFTSSSSKLISDKGNKGLG